MAIALDTTPKLTFKVALPGGQSRLREAINYVCRQCEAAPYFGLTKLNKIIWMADFASFAERAQPVTGRQYQRLEHGPAPAEMLPLLNEMQKRGEISLESSRILDHDERRPRVLHASDIRYLSPADLKYLDESIARLWDLSGTSTSDLSHGVAWKTRANGDLMPYELAYFADEPFGQNILAKVGRISKKLGLRSE